MPPPQIRRSPRPPLARRARSSRDIRRVLDEVMPGFAHVLPEDRQAPVALKPNGNAAMNALTGNTTDLRLLAALLQWLRDAGYTNCIVAEGTNSGFYRNNISVITRLRMEAVATRFGARVVDCNHDDAVSIPFMDGVTAQVSRTCMEAALLINLPKLKTHFEAGMSVCCKNLMGCLVGQDNKKKTHQHLAANILRLNEHLRPHLHIVDGLVAMEGLGPTRGTPLALDLLLLGEDPLALDLVCARVARFPKDRVATLRQAEAEGLLDESRIAMADAVDVSAFARPFRPPKAGPLASFIHHPRRQRHFLAIRNTKFFTRLAATSWFGELLYRTGLRQDKFLQSPLRLERLEVTEACDQCGVCEDVCPLGHAPWRLHDNAATLPDACLGCLYCHSVCPRQALTLHGDAGFFAEQCRQYDAHTRRLYSKDTRDASR